MIKQLVLCATLALVCCSCGKKNDWVTFAPEGGRFEIELPFEPKGTENRFNLPDGSVMSGWNYIAENPKGMSFTVGYNDWPESWVVSKPIDWFLDSGRDGMIMTLGGTMTRETRIELNGNPGRDVIGSIPGLGLIMGRVYMAGNRYYQVSVFYKPDTVDYAKAQRFFDSFKLK
jgi:hypothetical protein